MTSTTPPQPNNLRPPLKVVPPQPKTPEPSTAATSQSSPQFTFPLRRYLMMGGLLCGLGLVSLVNISNSVPGTVEVDSTPKSRDTVYMQIPGIIKQVLVEPNSFVKLGDPLVKIESDELTGEIEELELRIAEAQANVSRIQESIEPLKAELNIAKLDELATRQKAETLQAELHQITSGNPPPRILMIESEIAGLQTEKTQLAESLEVVQDKFNRLEVAVNAGAAAVNQLDQPLLEKQ
ncbi:MAG: biotin/lipoyl-binding protein, partial [Desertifilum sp. SIO1I2]|nr:biotin/lipoyl-binding protein [Desertifilum sp. SIO1I2]